ncbi:putative T7SS-secreted protein [Arthrobacter sp. 35W]|uniref:putative T7SS-secreted protein n=1 Tax=Arthrobacter sp. 35W TaxID=1132441 RepID=UPI0004078882|nr:hypothetical protein [Arthrobacter sp. 35W]
MNDAAPDPAPHSADMAALAAGLVRAADSVDSLLRRLHNAGQLQWSGRASAAFRAALDQREAELRTASGALGHAAHLLQAYAKRLEIAECAASMGAVP